MTDDSLKISALLKTFYWGVFEIADYKYEVQFQKFKMPDLIFFSRIVKYFIKINVLFEICALRNFIITIYFSENVFRIMSER